jgi:hypothetical protein
MSEYTSTVTVPVRPHKKHKPKTRNNVLHKGRYIYHGHVLQSIVAGPLCPKCNSHDYDAKYGCRTCGYDPAPCDNDDARKCTIHDFHQVIRRVSS